MVIISQYMYVTHIIMLYTLNLYGDMCQLFLNKTSESGGSGEMVGLDWDLVVALTLGPQSRWRPPFPCMRKEWYILLLSVIVRWSMQMEATPSILDRPWSLRGYLLNGIMVWKLCMLNKWKYLSLCAPRSEALTTLTYNHHISNLLKSLKWQSCSWSREGHS